MSNTLKPAIRVSHPLKFPIGISDFGELVRDKYTFVDKSLMIKELIEKGSKVNLITRPRRFGKTINLSMLQYFFSAKVIGQPTGDLFNELEIAKYPDIMEKQGHYPVIFLTFKDIKKTDFDTFIEELKEVISNLYGGYPELTTSDKIPSFKQKGIQAILEMNANLTQLSSSIKNLSELLYLHYQQKVVILSQNFILVPQRI